MAVMCSEALWWRCHRRLIADAASLLHGSDVRHLFHDGRLVAHQPTKEARVVTAADSELIRYDSAGGQLRLL